MQNRRCFLKNTAAVTTATTLLPALSGSGCSPDTERSKQNSRKKRIIWNNDADDLAGIAQDLGRRPHWPKRFETVDEYLALRMNHLKGTHVNGLAHCGLATIPHWELPRKNIRALGPDPVQPAVKFAHDNKMEFFFSIRMNDVHCAVYSGIQYWTPLKLENPHLLQSHISPERFQETFLPWIKGESPDHPHDALLEYWGNGGRRTIDRFRNSSLGPISFSWPAYDYARPEVRDHFLGVVREACRRYDLEGIELDWCRHPLLFRYGQERRHLPVMTDLIQRIHQVLEQRGKQRGRPILLSMRVPDSPDLALSVGLDVEEWVARGWVDFLIAGFGSLPYSFPVQEWIRMGRNHGIPVYGGLSWKFVFDHVEAIRGAAYRLWDEGVDGLHAFNFLDPARFDSLHEIGEPEKLANLDKMYQIDLDRKRVGYMNESLWPGQLPLSFATQAGPARFDLKLKIADRPERAKSVRVETRWADADVDDRVTWRVNGEGQPRPRAAGADQPGWSGWETRDLRYGENSFLVTVQPPDSGNASELLTLEELRVWIRYG